MNVLYCQDVHKKEDQDKIKRLIEIIEKEGVSMREIVSVTDSYVNRGIEIGREEGRKDEKLFIARNMKLDGLDNYRIEKITGLSQMEIEAIEI